MNRRKFIASASTATLIGASGCLGGALGGNDTVFENVQVQGPYLVVTFKSDTNIRKLNLINPDGSQFTSGRISAGESKISLRLASLNYSGVDYFARPGKYTLVAVDADENEHERKVNLQPDLSVTDVSFLGDQNASKAIDDYQRYAAVMFTVENTGNSPDIISDSVVNGSNVPMPRQPKAERSQNSRGPAGAGLTTPDQGMSKEYVIVGAGSTRKLLTAYNPFGFPAATSAFTSPDKGEYETKQALQKAWGGKQMDALAGIGATQPHNLRITVKFGGAIKKISFLAGQNLLYFNDSTVSNVSQMTASQSTSSS
jgi:hypothetical protein